MKRLVCVASVIPVVCVVWGLRAEDWVLRAEDASANLIAEAERLAAEARRKAESRPALAVEESRKALALTVDFQPTAFVRAGRKGEVVEDAYLAARDEYRRHRSRLYASVGECLALEGHHAAAARYLRRAFDLDPLSGSVPLLGRSLVALGRGRAALDLLLAGGGSLGPEALAVAEQAADAAGLPTLQAEIDRVRLESASAQPRLVYRDGPFRLPEKARLSTGAPLQFGLDGLTLLYVAEPSCRTCSADIEALTRVVPAGMRIMMVPSVPDEDRALRQTLALYRHNWPLFLGAGVAQALEVSPPAVLLVARRGVVGAVARPPLASTLPPALDALARADVRESVPRAAWNGHPAERKPAPARPGPLPEGLAPGEDEPAPPEFLAAVEAYRAGRAAEALRLFESLGARGDGWLLPPEGRLDRALCLAALGRREEARRLLLRTGDSRFQDAVDRALERVGSGPAR